MRPIRTFTWLVITVASSSAAAAPGDGGPALIPRPVEATTIAGEFELTPSTLISMNAGDPELRHVGEYLVQRVAEATGYHLQYAVRADAQSGARRIGLTLDKPDARAGDGYELAVSPDGVMLFARQPSGLFWGVQTLRQLLTRDAGAAPASAPADARWTLPGVFVSDRPRYRWRGMLLDCGRHFMPSDVVKRYIDLLAYHKMNVLHWHLTEDQGWRIEIRKYPRLTEVGAWRKATREDESAAGGRDGQGRYGGFYTQADIRKIVEYAQSRFVTIVPEIEMPGHSRAALAAYPELSCTGRPFEVSTEWGVHDDVYCAGKDQTFEFLEDVLSEVIDLFGSEFIHIGGDECSKTRWKACEKCRARIKAEGLKDERELQSYFIRRIERFLNGKGRRLIGWDEIVEGGLAPNATVQSWRGMDGAIAAATAGHDVIVSPTSHCYLDYPQAPERDMPDWMAVTPLEKVYAFEPTPPRLSSEQTRHILGIEGNVWTERITPERVDWLVFPRLCALAEVGWSPRPARDWSDFSTRLDAHYRRLDALHVKYFIPAPELAASQTTFADSIDVAFKKPFADGAIHFTTDGLRPTPASTRYADPIRLTRSAIVRAITILPDGRASDMAEFRFERLAAQETAEP